MGENKLRHYRKVLADWTLEEMATATGLSAGFISMIETGDKNPSRKTMAVIAGTLSKRLGIQVKVDEIFFD